MRWSSAIARTAHGARHPFPARLLEVAGDDQVSLKRAGEELDFLRHVRVGHTAQIAEQGAGAAVELVVEPFDGALVEDPLAPGLALGATQYDAPVTGTFLGPVQRVDELPRTVEADVELAGRPVALSRLVGDDVDLLPGWQRKALLDVRLFVGVHMASQSTSPRGAGAFSFAPSTTVTAGATGR